ncbi:TonB family protein [Sphingomonas sp.]|jgi:protein TonB|uniref:energy transducer TonB n=1 Tax=Sphingomonas sp. TaxID=28214 RepID=UPI002DEDC06A|nr:TonB family protein [Sphingomonas sp.]
MTADGFLNQRQRHPVAMAAAIAINLGAVTALMLAKTGVVVIPPGAIPLIPITEPPPPEPAKDTQPETKQPEPAPFVPPRQVPSQPAGERPLIDSTPSLPPLGGTGTGETVIQPRVEPTPTPAPNPVMVDAVPVPSAMRDFQPPYPPQLLRTGVEGKAVVRVLIGADGRVKQVAIISADDPLFADATERQALRKWRFRPATRDGLAVESWKQMTVRFEIRS